MALQLWTGKLWISLCRNDNFELTFLMLGTDNKVSDENGENEEQKVRYFIIPSPGPSGTPKKEASPVKMKGTVL